MEGRWGLRRRSEDDGEKDSREGKRERERKAQLQATRGRLSLFLRITSLSLTSLLGRQPSLDRAKPPKEDQSLQLTHTHSHAAHALSLALQDVPSSSGPQEAE